MGLSSFIIICSLLVLCEHALYKYLVPHAKRKSMKSCWRGSHVLFISQVYSYKFPLCVACWPDVWVLVYANLHSFQRFYRAIIKTGDSGWNVVRQFMARFRKMFSLNEVSFNP